jgi:hypothetical protein
MNWAALVSLIINILILVFFIILAIVLNQIRNDRNCTKVSNSTITSLYVGCIIFAVLSGIAVLGSIGALFWPERFSGGVTKVTGKKMVTYTAPVAQPVQPIAPQPTAPIYANTATSYVPTNPVFA